MDIKAKIDELVSKAKSDPNLLEKLKKDPVAAIEGIIGVDLPSDQIQKVAEGVMAKIKLDDIGGKLGGLFGNK
jgi:hypothetical protein